MKPIAKLGEMPFNVGGIKVYAAVDKDAQAITDELYIVNERSTRVFDLINSTSTEVFTFMQMVSKDKTLKNLELTATAAEIQALLSKNQFVVKVFDDSNAVLGYAYKFFPNKIVLSNGIEVKVTDYNGQTTQIIPVQSVSLNKSTTAGVVGATEQLTATVLPADATNKAVTWASVDPLTASVDNTGLVTFVKVGSTSITATSVADPTKSASCTVTVNPVAVTGVTLNDTTFDTTVIGATKQLIATVAPANATNKAVTWSSSAASIASVDQNGLVTTHAVGNATITVTTTDGSKTATCAVSITS